VKDFTAMIPNVITPNGDPSNEYFILPELGQATSLAIYNRWGDRIFYTSDYKNNWPQTDLNSGVYYYTLGGMCIPGAKGAIHLMR
jgi:gliding motility-associated-like protein